MRHWSTGRWGFYAGLFALLAIATTTGTAVYAETISGTARVTEGDLLSVNGIDIRLYGIDAPDDGQRCTNRRGVEYDCFTLSRMALERLTEGRTVDCALKPQKAEPRLGVCKVGSQDLAATMVRAGWALAYRRIAQDYVGFEARAMSHRTGMWAGRVEPPWLWRDRQLATGGPAKR